MTGAFRGPQHHPFPENRKAAPQQAEGNQKQIATGEQNSAGRPFGPGDALAIQQKALKGLVIHSRGPAWDIRCECLLFENHSAAPDFSGDGLQGLGVHHAAGMKAQLHAVAARDDMEMDMEDALAGGRAIQHRQHDAGRVQSLLHRLGDLLGRGHHAPPRLPATGREYFPPAPWGSPAHGPRPGASHP